MSQQRDPRMGRLWLLPEPGVQFGTFDTDERLIVSPDVMALLEADFPEAAREFRVDPIAEEFQRIPRRWMTGLNASGLESA